METNSSKKNLDYINYFRGLAICFIVASHSLIWGKPKGIIANSNHFIFAGGTWLFVFISGYLFQYLSYKFHLKDYFKKKFINVISPYFFTITPAILLCILFNENPLNPLYTLPKWLQVPSYYAFGFLLNDPLWFIGMIAVLFLLSPILLKISNNKILMPVCLLISCLYTLSVNRPGNLYIIYLQTNATLQTKYLSYINFYLHSALFFLSVYLLGMFVCKYVENNQEKIKLLAKPIFIYTFFILTGLYILIILKISLPDEVNIIRYLEIILFLSLFIWKEDYIKNTIWLNNPLNFLAGYSFGIFFLHKYFINLLHYHSIYDTYKRPLIDVLHNSSSSFFNAIGVFLFAIFGSIGTIWIVKKALTFIGIKNTRMFIGVNENKVKKPLNDGEKCICNQLIKN